MIFFAEQKVMVSGEKNAKFEEQKATINKRRLL